MKLSAFNISGQPIGTVVKNWTAIDLGSSAGFLAESSTSTGYTDISSITSWSNFWVQTTTSQSDARLYIKALHDSIGWNSLTTQEKHICSEWFVTAKANRDTIHSSAIQEANAANLSIEILNKNRKNKYKDAEPDEITSDINISLGISNNNTIVNATSESTNSTTAWVNKLTESFTPEETGNYVVQWSCELTNENSGFETQVRLQQDANLISSGAYYPKSSNSYSVVSGFVIRSLTANTSYSYTIDFKTTVSNKTARIRNVYFRIIKN